MTHTQNEEDYAFFDLDLIPAVLWLLSPITGKILFVNQACLDLYNYSKEEFLELSISEIDLFDDPLIVQQRTQRILKYGIETFETKHKTKGGKILDVVVTVKLITHKDAPLLSCTIHNKTNFTGNDERFKAIFESIEDGLLILDTQTQKFTYANHAILNMLDYSFDEIINIGVLDITLAEDRETTARDLAISQNSDRAMKFKDRILLRKNGSTFFADIDTSLPYHIENSIYVAAVIKDMTHQKETELLLEQKRNMYESLFNQLPQAAWLIDPKDASIVDVNSAAVKLYGYTKEEFTALKIVDIDPFLKESMIKENIKKIAENNLDRLQVKHLCKDGRVLDIQLFLQIVKIDGKKYISSICDDITEKLAKEKLFLVNLRQAQMGEMLSMIAHQWRQPLTAINAINNQMRLYAMMQDPINEKNIDLSQKIEAQIDYLSHTITDFRNFFKPNKEKVKVDIVDIVTQAVTLMGGTLLTEDIKLSTKLENSFLELYPNEVSQVVITLLKNSLDAFIERPKEHKKIWITSYKEGDHTYLLVEDNAGGIDKKHLDNIFLPYFSTKHAQNGTGLGLYMVKIIIEEHSNGKMYVNNTEDGVRFTICFNKL